MCKTDAFELFLRGDDDRRRVVVVVMSLSRRRRQWRHDINQRAPLVVAASLFVCWMGAWPGLVWSDRRVAVIEKTFHIKLTTINHSISQINKLFSLFLHLNAVSD